MVILIVQPNRQRVRRAAVPISARSVSFQAYLIHRLSYLHDATPGSGGLNNGLNPLGGGFQSPNIFALAYTDLQNPDHA